MVLSSVGLTPDHSGKNRVSLYSQGYNDYKVKIIIRIALARVSAKVIDSAAFRLCPWVRTVNLEREPPTLQLVLQDGQANS